MFRPIAHSLVLLLFGVLPAFAQQPDPNRREPRPYRGLFGGGNKTQQSLVFTGGVGGGLSTGILTTDIGTASGGPAVVISSKNNSFGSANGGLSYGVSHTQFSMDASFSGAARYNPRLLQDVIPAYSGGLGLSWGFSKRTRISANQTVSFGPYQFLPAVPSGATARAAQAAAIDPNAPVVDPFSTDVNVTGTPTPTAAVSTNGQTAEVLTRFDMNGVVSLSHELSKRAHANVVYGWSRNSLSQSISQLNEQRVIATFGYMIAKGLGAHVGYGRTLGDLNSANQPQFTQQNFDFGIDAAKALSISRNMTVDFGSGVAGLSDGITTRYILVGHVALTRDIGRTWGSTLSYDRNGWFDVTLRNPIVSDGMTVDFGGLVSRRVGVHTAAGVTRGDVGLTNTANSFSAYYGLARLQVGITRNLAFELHYGYDRYSFGDAVVLPAGLTHQSGRHSLSVQLSVWAPLTRTAARGRSNVAR